MSIRECAVCGTFYPQSAESIEEMIAHFNSVLNEHIGDPSILNLKSRAIIAPHAGYVYSAFTANVAFRLLANAKPKRVVVIGPSHRVYLKGASVGLYDAYETPYKNVPVDKAFAAKLIERFGLTFAPEAHHEHSTEVEIPLLLHYIPDVKIVEIVYSDIDPKVLAEVIVYLLQDQDTGVIISSDLSHYYPLEWAKVLDSLCLEAVQKLDPTLMHKGCEACGKIGIEAMIYAARALHLKPLLLDYRTSADASGDTQKVVSYMSAAFLEGEDA